MVSKTIDAIVATALASFIGSQIAVQNVQPFEPQELYYARAIAESLVYAAPTALFIYGGFRYIEHAVRKIIGGDSR